MSVLMLCPKKRGNTFMVSQYVVNNSDVDLYIIDYSKNINLKKYTSIIICSGVYGKAVHKRLIKWMKKLDSSSIHKNAKIYLFLTWLGRGKTDRKTFMNVEKILKKNNLSLESDYITCFGGKLFIKRSHPNQEDFKSVLEWVKLKN